MGHQLRYPGDSPLITGLLGNPSFATAVYVRCGIILMKIGRGVRRKMNRQQVINALRAAKPVLAERYGVTRLALFGSTARGEARPDSDVDVIVGFDGPANSTRYFGVQFFLEDELNCAVDLVTEKALRPELKPFIEREAVNV